MFDSYQIMSQHIATPSQTTIGPSSLPNSFSIVVSAGATLENVAPNFYFLNLKWHRSSNLLNLGENFLCEVLYRQCLRSSILGLSTFTASYLLVISYFQQSFEPGSDTAQLKVEFQLGSQNSESQNSESKTLCKTFNKISQTNLNLKITN